MTIQKRTGVQFPSFTLVNYAWECPVHGNLNLEYPVAVPPPGANVTLERNAIYCPAAGGHTFNLEDVKATIYAADGSVAASGVPASVLLNPGLPVSSPAYKTR